MVAVSGHACLLDIYLYTVGLLLCQMYMCTRAHTHTRTHTHTHTHAHTHAHTHTHTHAPLQQRSFLFFATTALTGNPSVGFSEEDLEGDFDPEKYDATMQSAFNEDYYQEEEVVKPEFSDDDEGMVSSCDMLCVCVHVYYVCVCVCMCAMCVCVCACVLCVCVCHC